MRFQFASHVVVRRAAVSFGCKATVGKILRTAIHEAFEKAASNAYVSEERLSHTVDGTVISGAIDYQFESDGEVDLKDYKSTSTYSITSGAKPEWERHLNGSA